MGYDGGSRAHSPTADSITFARISRVIGERFQFTPQVLSLVLKNNELNKMLNSVPDPFILTRHS